MMVHVHIYLEKFRHYKCKNYNSDLLVYCTKIRPYVDYYKRQINSYNDMVHNILKNEIGLILPQFPTKQK